MSAKFRLEIEERTGRLFDSFTPEQRAKLWALAEVAWTRIFTSSQREAWCELLAVLDRAPEAAVVKAVRARLS